MPEQSEFCWLTFSESINRIERELHSDYIGGFYQWADDFNDNAWTKAVNRVEKAIKLVMNKGMTARDFQIEQALYFDRVSALMQEYRNYKKLDESESFIKSFKKGE